MRIARWQSLTLVGLQLLFGLCAASVLLYRARGWAPDVIDFGWGSYRAFNIYASLMAVGYLAFGLIRQHRHAIPILFFFALFHLVEGLIIGFWSKAAIQLVTLILLAWIAIRFSANRRAGLRAAANASGIDQGGAQ